MTFESGGWKKGLNNTQRQLSEREFPSNEVICPVSRQQEPHRNKMSLVGFELMPCNLSPSQQHEPP